MQKIRVVLLMMVMCGSSFFVGNVKGEEGLKSNSVVKGSVKNRIDEVYNKIDFGKGAVLSKEVFAKAYHGFLNLKDANKLSDEQSILSVCDFSLSANTKRLWVIDLDKNKVIFHSLVAHGQGTGEEFAVNFSNRENSHQSSYGFYVTEGTYNGDNGYSLKLHGMDKGYNDNAYSRAIVMHGADYVCDSYIKSNQRLGRSWGCPAVPRALAKPIIDKIKDKTCLFIYYPNKNYFASSVWLNKLPKISEQDLIKEKYEQQLAKEKLAMATKPAATVAAPAQTPAQPKEEAPALPEYQGVKLAIGGR